MNEPQTPRQEAARRNGKLSKGPKTAAGKHRSAMNAVRHGLLSKCVLLESECPRTFKALVQQHYNRFQPADGIEVGMVEEMASCYWRLRRLWAMESKMMNLGVTALDSSDAHPDLADDDELARITIAYGALSDSGRYTLIHRYQSSLHRTYSRALRNLLVLRGMKKVNLPNEPNESL